MSKKGKVISGVLEHIIFALREREVPYTLKTLGKENGFPEQIIVRFGDVFVFIMKNKKRITYYLAEEKQKRRSISKEELLRRVTELI